MKAFTYCLIFSQIFMISNYTELNKSVPEIKKQIHLSDYDEIVIRLEVFH